MKHLMILGILAAGVTGCGAAATRAQSVADLTGSAASGKATYDAQCASCHGADGKGTSAGSSLVESVKTRTAESFLGAIINGVTGTAMVGYGTLSDQQLADAFAYVKELAK